MSGSDHQHYGSQFQVDRREGDDNLESFVSNWPHNKDRLMIFLGAGASIGAVDAQGRPLPSAIELRDELWAKFMADPNGKPLGLLSLEHASALIEARVGRAPLAGYLSERFSVTQPLWAHAALPFFKPKAVYTTNYDELIEKGWDFHTNLPRMIPVYGRTKNTGPSTVLYKPHGSAPLARAALGQGGVVINQFDYFRMLTEKREMLSSFLHSMEDCCVVFIGYSFQDSDIASELHRMRQQEKGNHWYAVFPRRDRDVRAMYEREYGIKQIDRTFEGFVEEVGQRLGLVPEDWRRDLKAVRA